MICGVKYEFFIISFVKIEGCILYNIYMLNFKQCNIIIFKEKCVVLGEENVFYLSFDLGNWY